MGDCTVFQTMSEIQQLNGRFGRRPSFWKTPQIIGKKRNYSQINDENNKDNKLNELNPNKKRRLLTNLEIENIAKYGGFNPSNIIIAVQESDGFCWFKRKQKNQFDKEQYLQKYWNINPSNKNIENNKSDNVLRELSKDELKKRNDEEKKRINPNQLNKEKAIERAAKLRRHTAPIHVLQKLIDENNRKKKELMIGMDQHKKKRKKKKKKKKKKKFYLKKKKKKKKKKKS